jgi:hypothetical protein
MSSKFKNILEAARGQGDGETDDKPLQRNSTHHDEEPPHPASARRRGRPAGGKRNDPDYEQVTAYIRRDIYRRVKIALLQEDQKTEFSQLVDRLLDDWLATKK